MDEKIEAKYGLRITPAVVEFTESKEKEVTVVVRNICINSTAVRFYPPLNQVGSKNDLFFPYSIFIFINIFYLKIGLLIDGCNFSYMQIRQNMMFGLAGRYVK